MSSHPFESDGVSTSSTAIDRTALVLGLLAATVAACFALANGAFADASEISSEANVSAANAATNPEGDARTAASAVEANASMAEAQEFSELFSHALHVRDAWWTEADETPEFAQDCRGCHIFDGDRATADLADLRLAHDNLDQGLCFSCHLTSPRRFEPGPGDVPAAADDPFPHGLHASLSCRECHGPTPPGALRLADDAAISATVPLALPTPDRRNGAACQACHLADPNVTLSFERVLPAGATNAERRLELTGARLRELYIGGTKTFDAPEAVNFDHAKHVDVADGSTCATCHTGFATSTETGSIEVDRPESCQRCHIGTEYIFEEVVEPSRTAATFLHDAHVGAAGLACTECHAYTPADPLAGDGAVGRFGLSARFGDRADGDRAGGGDAMYRACADCHEGVDRAPAMPARHGGDAFADCGDCHAFTHPLPTPYDEMRSARPRSRSNDRAPAATASPTTRTGARSSAPPRTAAPTVTGVRASNAPRTSSAARSTTARTSRPTRSRATLPTRRAPSATPNCRASRARAI